MGQCLEFSNAISFQTEKLEILLLFRLKQQQQQQQNTKNQQTNNNKPNKKQSNTNKLKLILVPKLFTVGPADYLRVHQI